MVATKVAIPSGSRPCCLTGHLCTKSRIISMPSRTIVVMLTCSANQGSTVAAWMKSALNVRSVARSSTGRSAFHALRAMCGAVGHVSVHLVYLGVTAQQTEAHSAASVKEVVSQTLQRRLLANSAQTANSVAQSRHTQNARSAVRGASRTLRASLSARSASKVLFRMTPAAPLAFPVIRKQQVQQHPPEASRKLKNAYAKQASFTLRT
mmetsp:Transcript_81713/g.142479  ORF Transcript_81713/g.142479 Transcript_81713/m.142479 type:complete len:208 (+) Transcript_81713:203-826(+)